MNKKVVITTITSYKDINSVRAQCALKTILEAKKLSIPIVVVDRNSHPEFLRKIDALKGIVIRKKRDRIDIMGPDYRLAMDKGMEITNGVFTSFIQAEKYPMVKYVKRCSREILNDFIDLNIPARKSFYSYPLAQQYAELLGNLHFKQVTGLNYDMWFGPIFIGRRAWPYFRDYKDDYGGMWDSLTVPMIRCIKNNLQIGSTILNYKHPKEQTKNEENNIDFIYKREMQLKNLTRAIDAEI